MPKALEDHKIDPSQLDGLVEQVRRLSTKAESDGLGPIEINLTVPDRSDGEIALVFVTPAIAGYTLRARISHSNDRYAFITPLGGSRLDFDQIRRDHGEPVCEHCGLARARKTTFLLAGQDGEQVQVGSTCLKEFLGDHEPKRALVQGDLVSQARQLVLAAAPRGRGESHSRLPSVEEFLAHVRAVTEEEGAFIYKRDATDEQASTAELSIQNFHMEQQATLDPQGRRAWVEVRPKHVTDTHKAIDEFLERTRRQGEEMGLFDARLVKALRRDVAWPEKQGMIATLFQRLDVLRKIQKGEKRTGPWLGTEGERFQAWLELASIGKPFQSRGCQMVALQFVEVELDAAITCFQPAREIPPWLKAGWEYPLVGTVGRHEEFRGQRVTVLVDWAIDIGGQGRAPRPAGTHED